MAGWGIFQNAQWFQSNAGRLFQGISAHDFLYVLYSIFYASLFYIRTHMMATQSTEKMGETESELFRVGLEMLDHPMNSRRSIAADHRGVRGAGGG